MMREQGGDVSSCSVVPTTSRPRLTLHDRVSQEPAEHVGIPVVGANKKFAVGLKIGGEPSDRLHKSPVFRRCGRLSWQRHDHTLTEGGIAASLRRGVFDDLNASSRGLIGEVRMENHMVEAAPAEPESLGPEGDETHWEMFVKAIVKGEDGPGPSGSVMADDRFASKESTDEAGEVLQLRSRDARDAKGVLCNRDSPAEPEYEATPGKALHGPRDSRRSPWDGGCCGWWQRSGS